MSDIVLIAHDLRSCHNVGSLLRTAEGLGVKEVWLTGYTPYPAVPNDPRLPHLAQKITKQIHKTALGAEDLVTIKASPDIQPVLTNLKKRGYEILALEQSSKSVDLKVIKAPPQTALIVGNEVSGLETEITKLCDKIVEIPMKGQKESFNVVQAAGMALYRLTNLD